LPAAYRDRGWGLWRWDGTPGGTEQVYLFLPGQPCQGSTTYSRGPQQLTDLGSFLLLSASDGVHGRELWRSDGTPAGTWLVRNINTNVDEYGENSSSPFAITRLGGVAVFGAPSRGAPADPELWRSDGSEAGTVQVSSVPPVRVGGGEGEAEVHLRRLLEDRQTACGPVGMPRGDGVVVLDREGEFAAAFRTRLRLDAAASSEAQQHAALQREHREGR
jgi:ELWxxDGT repeat protein